MHCWSKQEKDLRTPGMMLSGSGNWLYHNVSRGISDIQERCSSVPKQSLIERCLLLKLSSRCVERRGKVGEAPVYLQGVYGHAIHASIFRNARASRVVRACNVSRFCSYMYPHQWFIICISYWLHFLSLFLIPESTYGFYLQHLGELRTP